MQFANSRSVVTPDVKAASDANWKTARERAAGMERLVAQSAGPAKIIEVSEQLGLSKGDDLPPPQTWSPGLIDAVDFY